MTAAYPTGCTNTTHVSDLLNRLRGVRKCGQGWSASCPCHDDRRPSLDVRVDGGGGVWLKCFAGCATADILHAIGLAFADLYPTSAGRGEIEVAYDYVDKQGRLSFEVVRWLPKSFSMRRPDGHGGWINNLAGVKRVPYRLDRIVSAPPGSTVWVTEGERDVHTLEGAGLLATTSPAGADGWRDEFAEHLVGLDVNLLGDNDEAGRDYIDAVLCSLASHRHDGTVKLIELPNLPPGGDVSDWFADGGTPDELLALAESAAVVGFERRVDQSVLSTENKGEELKGGEIPSEFITKGATHLWGALTRAANAVEIDGHVCDQSLKVATFKLVRALRRALPPDSKFTPCDLEPVVMQWHNRVTDARDAIYSATTRFWFFEGWTNCYTPPGKTYLEAVAEEAERSGPPLMAMNFDATYRRLAAIVRAMHVVTGGREFRLSKRTAADLIHTSETTAWRLLRLASKHDELLKVVKPGQQRVGGRATTYRYIGGE